MISGDFKRLTMIAPLNPRTLFLIDAWGALLSVFLLGFVLVKFEAVFGMPRKTLYFLATFPAAFVVYDLVCYFGRNPRDKLLLKAIALANLIYCCLSFGLVILHYQKLTAIGLLYFMTEFVVVILIARFEFNSATRIHQGNKSSDK